MKRSINHRGIISFYNSVVVFLLLTIWITRASLQLTTILIAFLIIPIGIYFTLTLSNSFLHFSSHINHPKVWFMQRLLSIYCLTLTTLFFISMLINITRPLELLFTLALLPLPSYLFYRHWLRARARLQKFTRLSNILTKSFKKNEVQKDAKLTEVTELREIKAGNKSVSQDTAANLGSMINDAIQTVTGEYMVEKDDDTSESEEDPSQPLKGIADVDRRKFLKLIGATSLGFAVLSLVMPQKASAAFFGSVPGPGTVALKDSAGNQIDPSEKKPTDGYTISEIDDSTTPSYYGFVDKDGQWYISKENPIGSYRYAKGTTDFSGNWTGRAALTYDYFDVTFA
jgi:hypothetical protein